MGILETLCGPYDRFDTPREAFDAYGHVAKWEDHVSERRTATWFAILFKDGDEFYAVDFQLDGRGWWLSNDYIGPFATVREFKTEKLTSSLL